MGLSLINRNAVSLFGKRTSTTIHDDEFGDIAVRRVHTKYVRLKVQPDGKIVATMPLYATLGSVRTLINSSRTSLRRSIASAPKRREYSDGEQIGKSHRLHISTGATSGSVLRGQDVFVTIRSNNMPKVEQAGVIREAVAKALRREAKAYLPRRLKYLAERSGFRYEAVRFSHAKSRWGSCSSKGTISLNIALMTLPNELIDYVLLHELTHTEQMNHSAEFWARLIAVCPDARELKKQIAKHSPFL